MKGRNATVLTLAEKCKNILASNWQANLNTIKADAKGSKGEIYTSKVKYFVKKGKPYIWVPEKDFHNVLPARVALIGDVARLEKITSATESLREVVSLEQTIVKESSYSVSGVLGSSHLSATSRGENLKELLDGNKEYVIYKFNVSSCTYIDVNGVSHEVELEDFAASKADPLSPFATSLIDGINQSEIRRRALVLFCITHLKKHAKDALLLSVDRKGFDMLVKIAGPLRNDGFFEYQWKEFRITFQEEARDVEAFCERLVHMEEEAIKNVSSSSGL